MGRSDEFQHLGLFYEDEREYLTATHAFIVDGLESGESVLVAVPGQKISRMLGTLGPAGAEVEFWNMNQIGRNPGRIIPAVRDWVDHQSGSASRCRFIGEPIWPGRTPTETVEATRHEALINLAFAGCPTTILCPYDAGQLEPDALDDASRTHPLLIREGCHHASDAYTDPLELWRAAAWPLPDAPPTSALLAASRDLPALRRFTDSQLEALGVPRVRRQDLVLAVDEAATNAVVHGGGLADVRIWRQDSRVVCEVTDHGTFDEPLAGRRRPGLDWTSGRGVWLMNQLCDLVELRPVEGGTVARMHLELDAGVQAAPTRPADLDESLPESAAA